LYRAHNPPRKYEEYAYDLDLNTTGKSTTEKGREGIIVTSIGEDRLTLLEILGVENSTFDIGEKIYIGKEGRTKVLSVLGKMDYDHISSSAQSELETVIANIVTVNESKFVEYLNNARPLTPRIHALELIPGIGKTYMKTMLEEREKKKFESYQDLQERVGFKDPVKHISERIMDEITGQSRMNLFVNR
jgi:putative nucleotide binding protein